jgi:hypothetical protein
MTIVRAAACGLALLALSGGEAFAQQTTPAGATQSASTHTALTADQRDVLIAVNRLFDGMRTRDTAALRALTAPTLVIYASREMPAAPTVRTQTIGEFLGAISTAKEEYRERIWSPEIRVDGRIATVWAPYDFHRDGKFSHCGTDTFQLVRQNGAWIIAALTYTTRTEPCAAPQGFKEY